MVLSDRTIRQELDQGRTVITRVFQLLFDPPSLLSQREFRATFVPYSRRYYAKAIFAKAIFILTGVFNQAIRHSRRSGNPEPPSCAKTVGSAKTRRVDSPTSHQSHSRGPASGWMGERLWIPAAARMTGPRQGHT